ncbi:MAG: GspH/FimT family pseudopilin [Gammaproteobacteria bacterium]|uniref:GspH/FimT family pseudopilin n=1 Tax=Azohydromonas sp. TaxID=1872666 RepID=UPI002C09609C|nr:GspH/FimT family pseudopilin [Azohydromonas sp.]HMM83920.1 GspH/FimT family pseudopilin [Azohydromonas sp.]
MRPRRHAGFTLIEALLVASVTAVLLTLAVPSYSEFTARHRLLAAAEGMALDLALARSEAAQRGVPVYLLPRAGERDWCYAVSADPGCDCRAPVPNCALRVVSAGEHGGVALPAGQPVRFDPASGRSDGGTAGQWRAGARHAAEVRVHAAGRARVCSPSAPMPGVAAC